MIFTFAPCHRQRIPNPGFKSPRRCDGQIEGAILAVGETDGVSSLVLAGSVTHSHAICLEQPATFAGSLSHWVMLRLVGTASWADSGDAPRSPQASASGPPGEPAVPGMQLWNS